jgi:hypothetical protein
MKSSPKWVEQTLVLRTNDFCGGTIEIETINLPATEDYPWNRKAEYRQSSS